MNRRKLLALMAGTQAWPLLGHAQSLFPNRPIRIIVPFAAGSATDTSARVHGEALAKLTNQPVVVDNRPGASGILAMNFVKAAPADGYTLLFAPNSVLTVNPVMLKGLNYDPLKDIKPIITLSRGAALFSGRADVPYKTMAELIGAAKREKRPIAAGNYSTGYELLNTWLGAVAGVQVNHINYKGASQMLTDLIGGQLDLAVGDSGGAAYELSKEGRVRLLASTADQRSPDLPNVPTMKESGYPEFESWVWGALYVRSETPADITAKLVELMQAAVRTPEAKAYQATRVGSEALDWGPERTRKFQLAEYERFRQIAARAGLQPR